MGGRAGAFFAGVIANRGIGSRFVRCVWHEEQAATFVPDSCTDKLTSARFRQLRSLKLRAKRRTFHDGAQAELEERMKDIPAHRQDIPENTPDYSNRTQAKFLARLAHELRNPLAPIRMALQIMQMAEDDVATSRAARVIIDRQLNQLTHLIEDLSDISHLEDGSAEAELRAHDAASRRRRRTRPRAPSAREPAERPAHRAAGGAGLVVRGRASGSARRSRTCW